MIDDAAPTPVGQPNIVLITTDQQHHRLAGYAGDRYLRTPALDRLAREGTRFDLTCAANPVCVPSRYSLLTGHLPHRFGGLETNQQSSAKPLPAITDWVSTPPMGRCLHAAGYDTVYGGKLHVEGFPTFTPEVERRFGFRCLTGDSREELALRSRDFLLLRGARAGARTATVLPVGLVHQSPRHLPGAAPRCRPPFFRAGNAGRVSAATRELRADPAPSRAGSAASATARSAQSRPWSWA